jgi:hypothetical protein
MISTSILLNHLHEMIKRLGPDHPEINAFLERHKNNSEFQLLAVTILGEQSMERPVCGLIFIVAIIIMVGYILVVL